MADIANRLSAFARLLRRGGGEGAAGLSGTRAPFRGIFDASVTGMAISTPQGRYLEANAAYCRMLGYSEGELQARDFASLTHPADLEINLEMRDEVLAGTRDGFVMEKRYVRRNGDIQWARISISAVRTASGEIETLVVIAEDIGARKLAEIRLHRLNRLHTVLSRVGEAILRVRDRQALYDEVCRILVENGLLRMVYIAAVDAQERLARPVASAGQGRDYLLEPTVYIRTDGGELSEGTVGRAIRGGVHDVCNDIAAAARMKPWRDAAIRSGLLANASFPLKLHGDVIAVLVLYAGETDYFLDDEIELMVGVANNLSFALDGLEKEQRRQAAEALSARLAVLVESSDDAIVGVDPDGVITSWNKGAERMFGYLSEEVVGRSALPLVPAERLDELRQSEAQIRRGESLKNFETVRRAKDGRLVYLSVTKSPIWDDAGRIIGTASVARDITQARRSEQRLRRLVDSNIEGVFFWNTEGSITGANDAFLRMVGYSREDLAAGDLNWMAMTPPEYVVANRRSLEEMAASGVCTPFEKAYIRRDGTHVPVLIGSATFEDNPDEGVCFALDLTERRKLEHQFRQVQKMESIGTLAGGVAHDFNNLLAVIQLQTESLLSDGGLSGDQLEAAQDIAATVQRAAALTRQLLLFSSREMFQPRDLDLGESIVETTRMLRRLVGEHIEMVIRMAPHPMFLHADPGMIDQVLLNLVVNARDAMPDGGRLVIETAGVTLDESTASQIPEARAGSFICLSVRDSGSGIPPDILPKIFEPFFTTKDIGKGTGLGLSTVFGIVRQHRGWISVLSEVGVGTTVRVYLPRVVGKGRSGSSHPAAAAEYGGSETILLAEDDQSVRFAVQRALSQLGYRIVEAPTGRKALEVWRENAEEIRLLLTDVLMPDGMTGQVLADRILREDPRMKVIYMSGYNPEVIESEVPIRDGAGFITKPFSSRRLAQAVRICLDQE